MNIFLRWPNGEEPQGDKRDGSSIGPWVGLAISVVFIIILLLVGTVL